MWYPLLWRPGVDVLPEFDIHYDRCRIETVSDYTVYNDKGKNAPSYLETWEYYKENLDHNIKKAAYYPGFKLVIEVSRDPYIRVVKHFMLIFVLAIFSLTIFSIDFHNLNYRLESISVVFLTYI